MAKRKEAVDSQNETVGAYRKFIANVSVGFANNFRATLLLLISILLLGTVSYTTLLQRDGFPEVAVPIGIVNTRNFAEDASVNNEQITTPLEVALSDVPEVTAISSTTTDNFVNIFAEFDTSITSDEGIQIIKDEIEADAELPANVTLNYETFRASSIDGTNDLLFTISNPDLSIEQQEAQAELVAQALQSLPEVALSEPIEQITTEINAQGEEFEFQSTFQRIGIKNDQGEIVFQEGVAIGVVKRNGSVGTLELSDAVRAEVEQLQEDGELDGYDVQYGGDFAPSLRDQISSLEENALTGLLAVVVISFLFISWRSSIITAIFIPTVLAATFISLYLLGYTLNTISLFALILVLGLLVDDAIVVVESIAAKREEGLSRTQAIRKAVQEIGPADISGSLTTLLVFMPMLFISGVLGEFIIQIPITVILALSLSVTIALTIMPFVAGLILRGNGTPAEERGVIDQVINFPGRMINEAGNYVTAAVNVYLGSKIATGTVAVIGIASIFVGGYFAGQLEFNIFPASSDSEDVNISISYLPGTDIDEAQAIAQDVEQQTLEVIGDENVEYVTYYNANENEAQINVHLIEMGARDITSSEMAEQLEQEFTEFDEANVTPSSSSVGPPSTDFQFFAQIYSNDEQELERAATELESFLQNRQINDNEKVVETSVAGLDRITKNDGQRFVEVRAKLSNETDTNLVLALEDQVNEAFDEERLESLGLSDDALEFDKGQQSENLDSFNSTIFAFGVALILMFGLLVIQFNSYSQPLLVMFAIPLTFIGLFPGLYATGNPLSFFVMIGIIGLAGIVVNNTIMLIDFANQARHEGKTIRQSIVHAVHARFRPLITTSVTTVAGLLPLALSDPFWEGLAFSLIFGLIASSILVITIFPSYYAIVEKLRTMRTGLFARWGLA